MLSVIIICKNEEANIRRCLESVSFADELIVLDSGSSDNTVDIAREYTDQVYMTDWPGYGVQKQRALAKTKGDWVLNLDADESVTQELQKEILAAIAADEFDAFRIPIRMYFYGKALRFSSSPQRHIRLFKKSKSRYSDDIIHEKIIVSADSRISKIKQSIRHHSFRDLSHALYKMNKYSSYSAKTRIDKDKKFGFTRAIFGSSWMFFRCYIIQWGFLDGRAGFLFAVFNAHGTFYRGVKQFYRDSEIDNLPQVTNYLED